MSAIPLSSYVTDDIKKRYAIWVAQWSGKLNYSGTYGIWQHSDAGKVAGITGNVDLNYGYIDYPTQIKAKGLNGFGKQPETPKKEITVEMTVDGVNYKGTLKEV